MEKEKVVERDMTRVEKTRRRQGARAGPEVVMEVSKMRICEIVLSRERKRRCLNIILCMIYLNCRRDSMGTGMTHIPHRYCKGKIS